GDGVFGKVVVNDQRVHAVIHEPFAHGRSGKRGEVLVGRRIGSGRNHQDRVRQGARLIENAQDPGDVRLFLADADVDAIEGAVLLVARGFGGAVQARL